MTLEADLEVTSRRLRRCRRARGGDGETLALLGPNGAGKTTVVEAVAGLVAADRGRDRARRRTVDQLPPERRRRRACASRTTCCSPTCRSLENVAFGPPGARHGQAAARSGPASCSRDSPRRCGRPRGPGAVRRGTAARRAGPRARSRTRGCCCWTSPSPRVDVTARGQIRVARCARSPHGFDGIVVLVAHDPLDALTLADRVAIMEDGRAHPGRHARADPERATIARTRPTWWA